MAEWTYDDVVEHMGRKVLVTHILKRDYDAKGGRSWKPRKLDEPRVGWIAGWRTLRNGTYVPPSGGYEDYEPAGLAVKSTCPAVMVVFWPTEKPQPVATTGIDFDLVGHEPYTSAGYGSGKERKKMIAQHKQNLVEGHWPREPITQKFAKTS